MRKILFGVFGCLVAICAHAAQVVNVDYVHKLIAQKWDISVPIKTNNIMAVANMKYLLTAVDVANEILNGEKTTDYGNGEFATLQAADTVATIQAVDTLVRKEIKYKFFLTTTPDTTSFGFVLNVNGGLLIDWGDGNTELVDCASICYDHEVFHTYSEPGSYRIGFFGEGYDYPTASDRGVITFFLLNEDYRYSSNAAKIEKIEGKITDVFNPNISLDEWYIEHPLTFSYMFAGAVNLKSIPENLFAGISGAPAEYMFDSTFYGCSGLTSIPSDLFAGISGAPASNMFAGTFYGCSGLTSIPENLFGNISGTAKNNMFSRTFYNCTSLTGPSARINGQYLYEIWPNATSDQVGYMYKNATGLSDYSNIPTVWK